MNSAWTAHRKRIEQYLREGRTVSGGDRAAQNAAKTAEKTAGNVAATEQGSADAERAKLTPFYSQEMNAQHEFNPQQLQELLSSAGSPLAASAATTAGKATSEAARTRNSSGFSSALDQAARDRNAAMGTAGLEIGQQDVLGAKKLNQEGAAGEAGLFGQDQEAMLKAMGIQTGDINAETEAGKSGWLQNMNQTITALTGAAKNAGDAYKSFNS